MEIILTVFISAKCWNKLDGMWETVNKSSGVEFLKNIGATLKF
jgi:hypothetical protein